MQLPASNAYEVHKFQALRMHPGGIKAYEPTKKLLVRMQLQAPNAYEVYKFQALRMHPGGSKAYEPI